MIPLPGTTSFRLLLVLALFLIGWLATAELDGPVVVEVNDKLQHLAAFWVLALLSDFAFRDTGFGLAKAFPLLAYGLALECIQHFIPYRDFSLLDLAADALGLAAYAASLPILQRIKPLNKRWEYSACCPR